MKKLSSKIIAGLMASSIGLSPIMGTQVYAVWIQSAHQDKNIEDCTREELLEALPALWLEFLTVLEASYKVAFHTAYEAENTVDKATGHAVWDAAQKVGDYARGVVEDYTDNTDDANDACNVAYADAWEPGGAAYNMVSRRASKGYFQNLVRVLEVQTDILQRSVQNAQ